MVLGPAEEGGEAGSPGGRARARPGPPQVGGRLDSRGHGGEVNNNNNGFGTGRKTIDFWTVDTDRESQNPGFYIFPK